MSWVIEAIRRGRDKAEDTKEAKLSAEEAERKKKTQAENQLKDAESYARSFLIAIDPLVNDLRRQRIFVKIQSGEVLINEIEKKSGVLQFRAKHYHPEWGESHTDYFAFGINGSIGEKNHEFIAWFNIVPVLGDGSKFSGVHFHFYGQTKNERHVYTGSSIKIFTDNIDELKNKTDEIKSLIASSIEAHFARQ